MSKNGTEILVRPDGVAVISPRRSRLRAAWQEREGEGSTDQVIDWKSRPPDEAA